MGWHVPLPHGEREGGAVGDGRVRGFGGCVASLTPPHPSRGKGRGPLPSPPRGEGVRT
ncbi:L-lactate dehydrogenase complex protein LldG (fragment) [Sphingomonas aurantiaca]|uniref:L-lactate dehydrogenase complex protein LldG n=1 Tax=Sphingomonas aurantiaca TaxID=185949 RepID=A0A5E7Y5K5_9SPHN